MKIDNSTSCLHCDLVSSTCIKVFSSCVKYNTDLFLLYAKLGGRCASYTKSCLQLLYKSEVAGINTTSSPAVLQSCSPAVQYIT